MTLQLRPTFSESWYRVKNLRARLRSGAQISRQFYRGERWYVVRDPAGNQFHRLSDPAYRFVGLLDGSRTVEEAWDLVGGTLEDDAPTQPEVIQILSHLYSANLIDADVTPDATVLLRRHKQLSKRKMQNRLMNVLFPRIPLWDPDQFLKRWMPLVKLGLSKFGVLVWLAVVGTAIFFVASMWNEPGHSVREAANYAINLKNNPVNAIYLWGVFVLIKLIHELGHAFSCRRFGGECHELGIMFLVFIPTPYVDASSAWQFSNKWQRIFVGAGGMIVELFVAALATFVWANVDPHHLVGQLAFNIMLVAGVTTVVFNANPLLRYDGYYILSDFLEIPNLRQKSSEYAMGLLKRHVFGVKLQQPLPPPLQRFWLFNYAVFSTIYRTFVGIMIILLVAFQIPILGILMAIGGVVTWAVVPVFKAFKYLAIEPELHRKRGRATAFSVTALAAVIIAIGLVRFPLHLEAMGVVEPAVRSMARAESHGFVEKIVARDGQDIKEGDVILVCRSPELDSRIKEARAKLAGLLVQQHQAIGDGENPDILQGSIDAKEGEINSLIEEKEKLTVRAKISGKLIAPEIDNLQGKFLNNGEQIAEVAQPRQLIVHTLMEQKDKQLVVDQNVYQTEIRMAGDVATILPGGPAWEMPASTTDVRSPALTSIGGQEVVADPKDPKKSQDQEFDIAIPVQNPNEKYVLGQRANVRFTLDHRPLIWQWTRRFLQLIQTKSDSSQWL
jgi:putative peptide zinc metalloprotease protein